MRLYQVPTSNDAGEDNFADALGEQLGGCYRERLHSLFPRGMAMNCPTLNFGADGAAKVVNLLEEVLKASDSENRVGVKTASKNLLCGCEDAVLCDGTVCPCPSNSGV